MGLNLSGPAALCGLKPLNSLSMPSTAMLMSGIFVGDLAKMVGWHQSYANLAMTSGQGTLNLWGFKTGLGLAMSETPKSGLSQ